MHRKLAWHYRVIERSYRHETKTARQAKVLLCRLVKKPEGFKMSLEQAKNIPSHEALMSLGFAVCEDGFFRANPEVIKKALQ